MNLFEIQTSQDEPPKQIGRDIVKGFSSGSYFVSVEYTTDPSFPDLQFVGRVTFPAQPGSADPDSVVDMSVDFIEDRHAQRWLQAMYPKARVRCLTAKAD